MRHLFRQFRKIDFYETIVNLRLNLTESVDETMIRNVSRLKRRIWEESFWKHFWHRLQSKGQKSLCRDLDVRWCIAAAHFFSLHYVSHSLTLCYEVGEENIFVAAAHECRTRSESNFLFSVSSLIHLFHDIFNAGIFHSNAWCESS